MSANAPPGPVYRLLIDAFRQDLDDTLLPNWLDIVALNGMPTDLVNALEYAANTAHGLAESFEMQYPRCPDTWNAILLWGNLAPWYEAGKSAEIALSHQAVCMLIAHACSDVRLMRILWAEEESKIKTKSLVDDAKPSSKTKEVLAKAKGKAEPRAGRKTKKRKIQPNRELTDEELIDPTMRWDPESAPIGPATQFMHSFCIRHDTYALADKAPTWSDIAFVAGCRFERSHKHDAARYGDAACDLSAAFSVATNSVVGFARQLQHGTSSFPPDAQYLYAKFYPDKWSVDPQVGASYQYGHNEADLRPLISNRTLCVAIADACWDIVDLRQYALEILRQRGTEVWYEAIPSAMYHPMGASVPALRERLEGRKLAEEAKEVEGMEEKRVRGDGKLVKSDADGGTDADKTALRDGDGGAEAEGLAVKREQEPFIKQKPSEYGLVGTCHHTKGVLYSASTSRL